MAAKSVVARHVTWVCASCHARGKSGAVQTTQAAEEHADQEGHRVIASGMLTYEITPGTVETDDPFASKTAAPRRQRPHAHRFLADGASQGVCVVRMPNGQLCGESDPEWYEEGADGGDE